MAVIFSLLGVFATVFNSLLMCFFRANAAGCCHASSVQFVRLPLHYSFLSFTVSFPVAYLSFVLFANLTRHLTNEISLPPPFCLFPPGFFFLHSSLKCRLALQTSAFFRYGREPSHSNFSPCSFSESLPVSLFVHVALFRLTQHFEMLVLL